MLCLGFMDRKNSFNISVEGSHFIISTLKSPSGTSFDLYFAYEEYHTDDSNSPAERTLSPAESCLVSRPVLCR